MAIIRSEPAKPPAIWGMSVYAAECTETKRWAEPGDLAARLRALACAVREGYVPERLLARAFERAFARSLSSMPKAIAATNTIAPSAPDPSATIAGPGQ